jgi:regulatory protein
MAGPDSDVYDDTTPPDTPSPRMLSWARNSAIYRLGRSMHTEKQLFDAIARKAREKFEDITDAQVKALADSAVTFGYDINALDDRAYAETSSRSGMRSGKSRRAVSQKLTQKGVAKDTAAEGRRRDRRFLCSPRPCPQTSVWPLPEGGAR